MIQGVRTPNRPRETLGEDGSAADPGLNKTSTEVRVQTADSESTPSTDLVGARRRHTEAEGVWYHGRKEVRFLDPSWPQQKVLGQSLQCI